ncbi:hypothetical protein [Streptomyces sp. 2112.3]|uniref:hypothetical protein n=1 Tax=Streptomyces sp. 2112.3 TaxID=1881023 RepID=UPI00115FFBBA|nr:hypothetical protein [Streptomyces sp. 2112.3]
MKLAHDQHLHRRLPGLQGAQAMLTRAAPAESSSTFSSEPLAYIRARAGQLVRRSGRREPGLACTHRRRLRKLTLQVILRWLVHTPSNSTDLWKMVDEAVDDTDRGRTVGDSCVPSLRPRHLAGFHQTSRSERRQSFSKD